jgi:hypothetical protein
MYHSCPIIIVTISSTIIIIILGLGSTTGQEHMIFGLLNSAYFSALWSPVLSIFLQILDL